MSSDVVEKLNVILKNIEKLDKTVELFPGEVRRLSRICWILTCITFVIEKRGEFSKNLWREWVLEPSREILKFKSNSNREVISQGLLVIEVLVNLDIRSVDWISLIKVLKKISSHLYNFDSYRAIQTEGVLL